MHLNTLACVPHLSPLLRGIHCGLKAMTGELNMIANRSVEPSNEPPLISVVVPALDEAPNLRELYERLKATLHGPHVDWELIVVDDGSTDHSVQTLEQLHDEDSRVGFISLARSFGQQMAILAGIEASVGDAVIAMDADLQQPPELLPELIRRWRDGCPIVQTVRKQDGGRWSFKSLSSRAFYALIQRLSSVPIVAGAAEFFLVDRDVRDYILRCRERTRFNRGLLAWLGHRREFVEYQVAPRRSGESKFTVSKMFRLALDAIFSFSVVPLRVFGLLGILSATGTFVYGAYVLFQVFYLHETVRGWASIILLVGWFGSLQLLSLWAIGEYIARVYLDVMGRPHYVVEKSVMPHEREECRDFRPPSRRDGSHARVTG